MDIEKELDQAEKNLKLLRDGIPLRDENGILVGWMEKPDRAANQFLLEKKGKHRGYGEYETKQKTHKSWHEILPKRKKK
jgi:hypothetical protein